MNFLLGNQLSFTRTRSKLASLTAPRRVHNEANYSEHN